MNKTQKIGKKFLHTLISTALLCATYTYAQAPTSAPIPAQLLTAKTAFLGNAGSNDSSVSPFVHIAYDSLYHQLAASYQLAQLPAATDLCLEVSIPTFVSQTFKGDSTTSASLQLVIRDTKTQALLWTLAEQVGGAFREKTAEKNITEAAVKLAADLKALTSSIADTPQDSSSNVSVLHEENLQPKQNLHL